MKVLDVNNIPHTITVLATLIADGRHENNTDLHLLENNNLIAKYVLKLTRRIFAFTRALSWREAFFVVARTLVRLF